jgi:hypothetical protein
MGETHEAQFNPVIAEFVIGPEEEELILQPVVMSHEDGPVKELIHC